MHVCAEYLWKNQPGTAAVVAFEGQNGDGAWEWAGGPYNICF